MAAGSGGHGQTMVLLQAPASSRKEGPTMQQKRVELEEEVENLSKKLEHEEKVHRVLEGALQASAGSTIEIPTFLPKKTMELLAELAMVEGEINRLEQEMSKIHLGLAEEKALGLRSQKAGGTEDIIIEDRTLNTPSLTHRHSSPDETPELAALGRKVKPTELLKTQPLFFIDQAIRGDFNMHDPRGRTNPTRFSGAAAQELENPRPSVFERKAKRKSGRSTTPEPSTTLPAATELSWLGRRPLIKSSPKEPPVAARSPGKSNQFLQPNKLSENIMRCFIGIFLRMMRASRLSEPEKCAGSSSLRAITSFRDAEGGYPQKSSLTPSSGQLDPYGIFEIEGSIPRDIGPYRNLVKFTSKSMDARGLSSSMPLLRKLRVLMSKLQEVEPRFLADHQKLAFWINVYNICIMNGFLEHGLPSNLEKVLAFRNKAVLNIGGNELSARTIERSILRQPSQYYTENESWKDVEDCEKEDPIGNIYGLKAEPNVAFALCCGTRSSPVVRIYTADGIQCELEKAKLDYLQASIVVTADRKLLVPKLLVSILQHGIVGGDGPRPVAEWICGQLPTSGSLGKSVAECLKGESRKTSFLDVVPYKYDFQYLFFM